MSTHWPEVPLGDVLTERQETPEEQDILTGKIRIISKIGFNDGEIQLREETKTRTKMILAYPGDLVVSGINAAKGAIAIYSKENKEPIAATIHYGAYIPSKDKVELKYLWWLLRSNTFKDLLNRYVPGGIKTELKAKRLLPVPIPLPPLLEQRRIVEKIEEIVLKTTYVSELRKIVSKETHCILQSAMSKVFNFENSDSIVGDYAKVQGGYAFQSAMYDENGTHQIVRIGNVRDGHLDLSRAMVRWSPGNDLRVLRYELKAGDIVISMTGTRDKRDYGFIAEIPKDVSLLLNQRVGRFLLQRPIERRYLFYFLQSPFFRDSLFPSATGTANQANIGNNAIELIPFNPPSDKNKQCQIALWLDKLEAKINTLKKLQTEIEKILNALLPSILDRAFKGKL